MGRRIQCPLAPKSSPGSGHREVIFLEKQPGGLGQKMLSRMQPEAIMDSSLAHSGLSWFQGEMVTMGVKPGIK